jgi:hypothetical protein
MIVSIACSASMAILLMEGKKERNARDVPNESLDWQHTREVSGRSKEQCLQHVTVYKRWWSEEHD